MAKSGSKLTVRSIVYGSALALAGVAGASALSAGCGSDGKDYFVVQYDAGSDAEDGGGGDAEPDFDPTLGGPCTEDSQCDDLIPCTFDRCDTALSRCRNTPDDTQCSDSEYCNGQEKCVLRTGCVPGPVVTCQDDNLCTIDRCVEATKSCERSKRDSDGDGDPDDHCEPNRDCDDTDPTVSSLHAEILRQLQGRQLQRPHRRAAVLRRRERRVWDCPRRHGAGHVPPRHDRRQEGLRDDLHGDEPGGGA